METKNSSALSVIESFNAWLQESMTIKLVTIGFLVVILLIPSAWIQHLIEERESRAGATIDEIASKWSGRQTISGPVLVIPFTSRQVNAGGQVISSQTEKAFFLAEELAIDGEVKPEALHRGIFDVVVYQSDLRIKSNFTAPDFRLMNIAPEDVHWQDAYFAFSLSDLRGIAENPKMTIGSRPLAAEPASDCGLTIPRDAAPIRKNDNAVAYDHFTTSGIVVRPNWKDEKDFNGEVVATLSVKGSKNLHFIPSGKTTTVKLAGDWNDPSFDGDILPAPRTVTDDGFQATWHVSHFNRPFTQHWKGEQQLLRSTFGVNLLMPVDQYHKTLRTAKYGLMIILLTFIAMFLVEIIRKIRIHPFQYTLIGAALIVYYTLLLSISEHFGFNFAYVISSGATIVLVTLYASTFLHNARLTGLFGSILAVFYGFIFVIIQEQDYSLLIGSVGLFLVVATLMFFSRNINWYVSPTRTS